MERDLVKESMIRLENFLKQPINEDESMTNQEFERLLKTAAPGVKVKNEVVLPVKKKKSNRGNIRCEVDGINFHSKKEAEHYQLLKQMQKSGLISDLKWQVKFQLNQGGTHSFCYIADFTYLEKGKLIVVDVKGYDLKKGEYILSQLFKKKMKLMKRIHNLEIKIV